MTVGERLVFLRNKTGFSQRQMAQKLGVSRTTYTKWETNVNKPIRQLEKLAAFFHVSTDYILGGDRESHLINQSLEYSTFEQLMVQKYRALSKSGRELIDGTLNLVYRQEHPQEERRRKKQAVS